jgi:large subunit ribosomal protein L21
VQTTQIVEMDEEGVESIVAAEEEKPAGDDLTKIQGVGSNTVKKLNNMGISTYAEIAAWTPEEAAAVDKKLNYRGRILREDWAGQAKLILNTETTLAKAQE